MAVNNYEVWREDWRRRFLSMDHHALLEKLPFLRKSEDRLWLTYFSMDCALRLSDGRIEAPRRLTINDELNIYTLLWYAKPDAALTGQWVPFVQLKNASPFGPAFQKGSLAPFAATFSGHGDLLEQALLSLGGKKLRHGDVGYQIDAFPCIPMQVLFWEGDDEFPAQANLLFDRSAVDFIHVESVVTIASQALNILAQTAGLPVRGAAF